MKILPIVLVLFLAVVFGLVQAFRHLPWWGSLLLVLGLAVVGKCAIKRVLLRLFVLPFRMKGAVLKGASVQIHSISPAPAPPPPAEQRDEHADTEGPASNQPRRNHYQLDVTISPREPAGKFTHWEPGELRLVRSEAPENASEVEVDEDSCVISQLQVEQDGRFQPDEGYKYSGPRRLKMVVGVRDGLSDLKFRYYFESFGRVNFPTVATLPKAA